MNIAASLIRPTGDTMAQTYVARAQNFFVRDLFVRLVAVILLASGIFASQANAQSYRFNTVAIEGTQRIDAGTVLSYAEIPRGQAISAGQLNAAYQRILSSGLFETVEMVPQGGRLLIRVVEFPTINVVNFEGNRRIKDDALSGIVQSQSRRVYSPTVAEQDAAAITEAYAQSGRYAATVTPKIIRRSENRVDLVFEIIEGRVVEIERLSFVGNRNFSDRRLRQVLETKQAGFLRQLIQRDTFVADRIEFDKQVLRDFYLSRGFVDFQVLSVNSEVTRQRDAFFVTFNIREGQQFRFGEVVATSDLSEIDPQDYQNALRIRSGAVYSPAIVERNIARLETLALRQGLDFIRVEPRITRNDRDLTLDIEFALVKGPRIFVQRIDIEGNVTTLDRVVRSQFRTVEGDPFNPREIRESAERIRAMGFFSNAEVDAREGASPDQVIVDVNVEEQPTGSLSFGLSYSVSSGASLAVKFTETNFVGRGQTLRFGFDTSENNSNFNFGFVEPNFLSRDLRFSTNLFYRESKNDNSRYSIRSGGLGFGIDFPVGEYSRLGLRYGARFDDLYRVNTPSPILQAEAGKRTTSSLGYSYTYDTRKTGLNPNAGVLLRFDQDVAGLGGDNRYLKSELTAVGETKVWNEEVTLRAVFRGGALNYFGNNSSRVTDRFFGRKMRGFEPSGIGPRSITTNLSPIGGEPLGGDYYAVMSLESEFPIGLPEEYGITGGLFLDVGSVWGLDNTVDYSGVIVDDSLHWRSAAGFSIFWKSPLGPLRFNFSTALEQQAYDKEQNFDFTISTEF